MEWQVRAILANCFIYGRGILFRSDAAMLLLGGTMSVDSSGELVVHDVQARLHWPKSEGGARILAHVQTAAVR